MSAVAGSLRNLAAGCVIVAVAFAFVAGVRLYRLTVGRVTTSTAPRGGRLRCWRHQWSEWRPVPESAWEHRTCAQCPALQQRPWRAEVAPSHGPGAWALAGFAIALTALMSLLACGIVRFS
jgi:hypothetical protein